MEMFILLEAIQSVKDELKYVTMEYGGLYVIMDGVMLMQPLCAGSWVFKEKVIIMLIHFFTNHTSQKI